MHCTIRIADILRDPSLPVQCNIYLRLRGLAAAPYDLTYFVIPTYHRPHQQKPYITVAESNLRPIIAKIRLNVSAETYNAFSSYRYFLTYPGVVINSSYDEQ